jgi:hypothetical protein
MPGSRKRKKMPAGGDPMTAHLKSLLSFEQEGGFFTYQGDWVPSTSFKVIPLQSEQEHPDRA